MSCLHIVTSRSRATVAATRPPASPPAKPCRYAPYTDPSHISSKLEDNLTLYYSTIRSWILSLTILTLAPLQRHCQRWLAWRTEQTDTPHDIDNGDQRDAQNRPTHLTTLPTATSVTHTPDQFSSHINSMTDFQQSPQRKPLLGNEVQCKYYLLF